MVLLNLSAGRLSQNSNEGRRHVNQLQAVVVGLVPSIGIGFLFYKVMRAIIEGDRNERLAHSQWEAAQAAELEAKESTT